MTATGTPQPGPRDTEPTSVAGEEALSPSTEAWIERMVAGMKRMSQDEDYRLEIAKRLS